MDPNTNKGDGAGSNSWEAVWAKTQAAGAFIAAKAKEIDEKHQVVAKTKAAGAAVVGKSKELDEKHQITQKTKEAFLTAGKKLGEFSEKHQLTEKTKSNVFTTEQEYRDNKPVDKSWFGSWNVMV